MAARELLRRPRSFLVPAGILLLLALLLLYPSAILDGLTDSTTGALRTAPADLIVYSEDAKSSLLRSRVDAPTRDRVEAVEGVGDVAAFDVMLLGGLVPERSEPVGLAVLASERPLGPELPGPGEAYADETLRDSAGIEVGDTLIVGPLSVSVEVVGYASEVNLFFQSGLVVERGTWRRMMGQAATPDNPDDPGNPDDLVVAPGEAAPGGTPGALPGSTPEGPGSASSSPTSTVPGPSAPSGASPATGGTAASSTVSAPGASTGASTTATTVGGTTAPGTTAPGGGEPAAGGAAGAGPMTQALLVTVDAGADPLLVADAVDEATGGVTDTITPTEAVRSLPGMAQQQATFGAIRVVTLGVALVVVGLFLSFMTLERTPLYAVLKALGMSSRQLFTGVVTQVLLVTVGAALLAAVVTWGLTHIPLELPTSMRPVRLAETLGALSATSVVGSILSLRRVVRVDPASAIG